MNKFRKLLGRAQIFGDERGLSTVEYVIILVLVAVGGIGLWTQFGTSIGTKIHASTGAIDTLAPVAPAK